MKNKTIVYYDFEATSVSRDADMISVGLKHSPKYKLFMRKEEIIGRYLEGESVKNLANLNFCSTVNIRALLKRENITIKVRPIKYKINIDYFSVLNNENCYWLGFLFADGYNNTERNRIALTLQENDYDSILSFKNCLMSNHPIVYKKYPDKSNQYCFEFANKKISKDLDKLGMVKNKSLILKYPNIPTEFNADFIRGYFDGDGSISYPKNPIFALCGTFDFLNNCKQYFVLNGLSDVKIYKSKNIYVLQYTGRNNIKKIYTLLYSNTPVLYMKRKKIKFESILN